MLIGLVVAMLVYQAREVLALSDEEWCAAHGVSNPKAADSGGGSGGGSVVETELYDTLGLPPDANTAAIKKVRADGSLSRTPTPKRPKHTHTRTRVQPHRLTIGRPRSCTPIRTVDSPTHTKSSRR